MTGTVYTIHRAEDHAILATANPSNLQQVAATVARNLATSGDRQTRRAYVHNGVGIVGAGLCRGGAWHDMPRDDFQRCEPAARAERVAAGYTND
jgi:hypothetical protein